jgi:L-iditol 2-dehydrogenase
MSMRALVWQGPRSMRLETVPTPVPADGEVLLRVERVGICGSELSGYLGHNTLRKPPLVMGHEFSGTVVGGEGIAQGTLVAVNPLLTCGRCRACTSGRDNLCEQRALVGAHRPGAFAELVAVPAAACMPLGDSMDATDGALVEPMACAVRAVRLGGVDDSVRVRILGGGTIGLLCAVAARHLGAAEVRVQEPNPSRAAVARAWGFDTTVPTASTVDVVIDAVGLEATRREAVGALARGGVAVFVGLHEEAASFAGNDLVRDERRIAGCFAYTRADFATAAAWIAAGILPPKSAWTSDRPLDAGPASFDELVGPSPDVVKIVLHPSRASGGQRGEQGRSTA